MTVAAGDASALKSAAHTLKGAVDNFAARPTFEAAWRLENLGRNGTLADASQALSALEKELDRLEPALWRRS